MTGLPLGHDRFVTSWFSFLIMSFFMSMSVLCYNKAVTRVRTKKLFFIIFYNNANIYQLGSHNSQTCYSVFDLKEGIYKSNILHRGRVVATFWGKPHPQITFGTDRTIS